MAKGKDHGGSMARGKDHGGEVSYRLACASTVIFMQAGFMLLEAGSARIKHSRSVLVKNIAGACLSFISWATVGAFIGNEHGNIDDPGFVSLAIGAGFCATASTIVSGAIAERTRIEAYLVFSMFFSALVYPTGLRLVDWAGSWNLYMHDCSFHDAAGGTTVHVAGGVAAGVFAKLVGPRLGRFGTQATNVHGHNAAYVALGTFILMYSWFGFNGSAAVLSLHENNANAMETAESIFLSTLFAAAAGPIGSELYLLSRKRRLVLDPRDLCNGLLAGLAAITAGCDVIPVHTSIFVGASGAALATAVNYTLKNNCIVDDVVGAVGVHAVAGAWGTLCVGFCGKVATPKQFLIQLLVTLLIGAYSAFTTGAFYLAFDRAGMHFRASAKDEVNGLDGRFEGTATEIKPPEGVVTIVETDIASSSALWEGHPMEMSAAQEIHDMIMRECMAQHRGYEVATEGDAFCIAFENTIDAASFCLDVQRKMSAAKWPNALETAIAAQQHTDENKINGLLIRMAIDTSWCQRTMHNTFGTFHYRGKAIKTTAQMLECMPDGGMTLMTHRVHRKVFSMTTAMDSAFIIHLGRYDLHAKTSSKRKSVGLFALLPREHAKRLHAASRIVVGEREDSGFIHAPGVDMQAIASVEGFGGPIEKKVAMVFVTIIDRTKAHHPAIDRVGSYENLSDIDNAASPTLDNRFGSPDNSLRGASLYASMVTSSFKRLSKLSRVWPTSVSPTSTPGGGASSNDLTALDDEDLTSTTATHRESVNYVGSIMRETLKEFNGYFCQEHRERFMFAFENPRDAILWAMACSDAVDIRSKSLTIQPSSLAIGIHYSTPRQIRPHDTSGRADYFGDMVNTSARVASRAADKVSSCGGSVVMLTKLSLLAADLDSAGSWWQNSVKCTSCGETKLKGIKELHELYVLERYSANGTFISEDESGVEFSRVEKALREAMDKIARANDTGFEDSDSDVSELENVVSHTSPYASARSSRSKVNLATGLSLARLRNEMRTISSDDMV